MKYINSLLHMSLLGLLISTPAAIAETKSTQDDHSKHSLHGRIHDNSNNHGHDHKHKHQHDDAESKNKAPEGEKHAAENKDEAHQDHSGHDHQDEKHEHGKPHHGGIMAEVDGIHHELASEEGKLILYAEGLPEGDALNTISVRLSILQGIEKQDLEMALSEEDKHRFEVATDIKLAAGNVVIALIKIAEDQTRIARFEVTEK